MGQYIGLLEKKTIDQN